MLSATVWDLMGPMVVSDDTRTTLVRHLARGGDLRLADPDRSAEDERRVADLLALIVTSREYQLA